MDNSLQKKNSELLYLLIYKTLYVSKLQYQMIFTPDNDFQTLDISILHKFNGFTIA